MRSLAQSKHIHLSPALEGNFSSFFSLFLMTHSYIYFCKFAISLYSMGVLVVQNTDRQSYQGRVERSVGRHRSGHAALLTVNAATAHGSTWRVQGAGRG